MGKQYSNNWGNSPAGRAAKPGFGGKDTRLFSGETPDNPGVISGERAPGISLTGGGRAEGLAPHHHKKANYHH